MSTHPHEQQRRDISQTVFFFPRPGHDPRNHHGWHMWPRVNMVLFYPLFAGWCGGGHDPYNHRGRNL